MTDKDWPSSPTQREEFEEARVYLDKLRGARSLPEPPTDDGEKLRRAVRRGRWVERMVQGERPVQRILLLKEYPAPWVVLALWLGEDCLGMGSGETVEDARKVAEEGLLRHMELGVPIPEEALRV